MPKHYRTLGALISDIRRVPGNTHMFEPSTLKFFGVRLSESRLLMNTKMVETDDGEKECYVISERHRNYPGGARRVNVYFNVDTLQREFEKTDTYI